MAERRFDGLEFVYECYSADNELLYVGRTNNPYVRFVEHRRKSPWLEETDRIVWTQCPNLEHQFILSKKPKYNKQGLGL